MNYNTKLIHTHVNLFDDVDLSKTTLIGGSVLIIIIFVLLGLLNSIFYGVGLLVLFCFIVIKGMEFIRINASANFIWNKLTSGDEPVSAQIHVVKKFISRRYSTIKKYYYVRIEFKGEGYEFSCADNSEASRVLDELAKIFPDVEVLPRREIFSHNQHFI